MSDREVRTVCRFSPNLGYDVAFSSGPRLYVAPDGSAIALEDGDVRLADPALPMELLLGPGLILALTLHGTFCLHASAVAFHGRAVAFLGDSGAGKSTLAAALADLPGGQWSRLVDDVLPLRLDDAGCAVALPEFPQLKLEPAEQYVARDGRPERVPLAAIYVLAESPTGVSGADLAPRNAVAALTAHSLSTRLFAPELTARHLAFCAGLVEAVPVRTLAYPRRMAVLPEVAEWLATDLARARHLGA